MLNVKCPFFRFRAISLATSRPTDVANDSKLCSGVELLIFRIRKVGIAKT